MDESEKFGCSTEKLRRVLGENTFGIGGCLFVEGEITASTLTSLLDSARKKTIGPYGVLYLNSPGGSVKAAMSIGKELRRMHMSVFITKSSECTSACVLILAGAVNRMVFGRVGLHRPYLQEPTVDFDKANVSVREVERAIRGYLQEMSVPTSIYDTMKMIPPERVKYLVGKEYEALGIPDIDPAQDEFMRSLHAQKLGLTMAEYVRRASIVEETCARQYPLMSDSQQFFDCRREVFGGW